MNKKGKFLFCLHYLKLQYGGKPVGKLFTLPEVKSPRLIYSIFPVMVIDKEVESVVDHLGLI